MKRSLLIVATMLTSAVAFAQSFTATWVKPVPATVETFEYSTFAEEGDTTAYYLYNVGASAFFTEGNAWGTQASIGTTGLKVAVAKYLIDTVWDNQTVFIWDFSLAKNAWKQLFIDSETQAYVDLGSQANYYWEIVSQGNKNYRIKGGDLNPDYNGEYWFGVDSEAEGTTINPRVDLGYDPTAKVDWQFVTEAAYEEYLPKGQIYEAAMNLKTQIEWAMEQGVAAATLADEFAVYNNTSSTLEQLQAAAKSAYEKGRFAEIAVYFENIVQGEKNDVSGVLENNDFSAGNADGWDITYTGGSKEATNIGYQSASYTNGDVKIEGFIEAWKDTSSPNFLGDGSITQTVPSLPAGKYTLAVDVIANNQGRINDPDNTDGLPDDVELYAQASEDGKTYKTSMATRNGAPEHFEFTFIHTGGDMTLGLRVVGSAEAKMPANWIAMDNLMLYYYGEVSSDPDKALLDVAIDEALAAYPLDFLSDVVAYVGDKEAFRNIIEEAQAATENYLDYIDKVKAAKTALDNSVAAYKNFAAKAADWASYMSRFDFDTDEWGAFCDFAGDMESPEGYPELTPGMVLEEQSLTVEEINAYIAQVDGLYKSAVAKSLKAGDDVTALIENPDFEYGLSSGKAQGWTVTVSNNSAGGNITPGPLGTDLDQLMIDAMGKTNHCFEAWHVWGFDVWQEVQDAPAGVYQISAQGYVRCEASGYTQGDEVDPTTIPIKLYMNNFTSNFPSVYSEQVPEDKYDENGSLPGIETWSWSGTVANYPNSMGAASLCFSWDMYNVNTFGLVKPGEAMRVGVKGNMNTNWWCIWDNFKITYQGFLPEYVQPALETALAEIDVTKPMAKSLREKAAELQQKAQDAIATGNGETMFDVLVEVSDLMADISASVLLFADLQKASEDLQTAIDASSADAAVISEAKVLRAKIEDGLADGTLENADAEDLIQQVKEMIGKLAIPVYEGASDENPVDFTSVIVNPDFETGDASGWTYAFENVTNIGFQNNSTYSNVDEAGNEALISNFIEGWRNGAAIGDGSLEQTIYGLPEGTYTLEADIIANNQTRENSAEVAEDGEGFFLFAKEADGQKSAVSVATGNGSPLHFLLTFAKAAANTALTIGVEAVNATGNWLAADNFKLIYYGKNSSKTADGDASGIDDSINETLRFTVEYFTLDGRKATSAQKGIVIQRTTFENGAVQVRKIRK
ncbi:MAG: hypothetical protein K5683_04920 [Prevotella sp.]|nr:hypothetical protein [Prevotella sp.]